jgi:protein-S-isoprenylcysteine O-methyltransferase Ste14
MTATLVVTLRAVALLAAAAPLLLAAGRPRPRHGRGGGMPLLANLTASGLFFPVLLACRGTSEGCTTLLLALAGCLLAVGGAYLVVMSRRELGPAWSFAPLADKATGPVTTGPYRLVRHPIYLGFSMLAMGQTLAFASWPALLVAVAGIVPSFVWRATAEERLLAATFGERYTLYRARTPMIFPCPLRRGRRRAPGHLSP